LLLTTVVKIIVAVLSTIIVFVLQNYFLRQRPASRKQDSPASFFELNALASAQKLRNLCALCALPFAALFFVIALESQPFVLSVKGLLRDYILTLITNDSVKSDLRQVIDVMPEFLDPLFVLIATLALFAPVLNTPLALFRKVFIFAMGLEARADSLSYGAARAVLQKMRFEDAEAKLSAAFHSTNPMPEELVNSSEAAKLAYQLLHYSKDNTRAKGLELALASTLAKIGVGAVATSSAPTLAMVHIGAAIVFYIVLCVAYVLFAPLAAPWLQSDSTVIAFLQPIEWPIAGARNALALSVAQRSLSFVVPLASGMYLYASRRTQYLDNETWVQSFVVVFGVQFMSAFFVNLIFAALTVLKRSQGELQGVLISFDDVKIWADVFTPSLAPGAALLTWVMCEKMKFRLAAFALVCVVAGISFHLCQFTYECIAGSLRGYYWHQMVLGSFLTLAYYLAGLVAQDTLLPRPGSALVKGTEFRLVE